MVNVNGECERRMWMANVNSACEWWMRMMNENGECKRLRRMVDVNVDAECGCWMWMVNECDWQMWSMNVNGELEWWIGMVNWNGECQWWMSMLNGNGNGNIYLLNANVLRWTWTMNKCELWMWMENAQCAMWMCNVNVQCECSMWMASVTGEWLNPNKTLWLFRFWCRRVNEWGTAGWKTRSPHKNMHSYTAAHKFHKPSSVQQSHLLLLCSYVCHPPTSSVGFSVDRS